jgi:outer membrane protein
MRKVPITIITAIMLCIAATTYAADAVYTLEDAYQAALGTNELVKIAEEGLLQSENRVDQAWTYLYPRLIAQSAYTVYNDTLPKTLPATGGAYFQPNEQFRAALILTQPLYTGGRTFAALRTAQRMKDASNNGLSVAKQDILLRVSEAYYGVLKAQKSVIISQQSLERMERSRQVTERVAATRGTKANSSALLRVNMLVSQARINLIRAQDGTRVAKDKLSLFTKMPPDSVLAEPNPPDQPTASLEELKSSALKNRGDYAASNQNKSIAAEYVTIVKGAHYPQLYAEAGLQYLGSQPNTPMDATTYYGGLRMQIPIFEGGLMKAEVSEARSKVRQAELSSDFLRKSIESDVLEAYLGLQTVSSVLEAAKLQMEYARDNFTAIEGLYSEGLVSSLSLIDAEQGLSMAERELMNAAYDRQLAILRLKKSIGMLGKES